jgi:hypothetical protein
MEMLSDEASAFWAPPGWSIIVDGRTVQGIIIIITYDRLEQTDLCTGIYIRVISCVIIHPAVLFFCPLYLCAKISPSDIDTCRDEKYTPGQYDNTAKDLQFPEVSAGRVVRDQGSTDRAACQ